MVCLVVLQLYSTISEELAKQKDIEAKKLQEQKLKGLLLWLAVLNSTF
jgi:hypothetical protein